MLPVILVSASKNEHDRGEAKYNGGYKVYNLWVKLLREQGYPAFIVTHDGKFDPWLIEHQPHISMETMKKWKQANIPMKFVTGWLDAKEFLDCADHFYFYDCELAYTDGPHGDLLREYSDGRRLEGVATNSRHQQAWYLGHKLEGVALVGEWSDASLWKYGEIGRRIPGRVGYMVEGHATGAQVRAILARYSEMSILPIEAQRISGSEVEVIAQMQTCDIFLGMNMGKHRLWGEGCPRSQQEAMHCGCVVVAFDVRGNREYLIDNYTGVLCDRGDIDAMAEALVNLMGDVPFREIVRRRSGELISTVFTSKNRWPEVRNFLGLEDQPDDRPPLEEVLEEVYSLAEWREK